MCGFDADEGVHSVPVPTPLSTPLFGNWILDPSLSAFAPERPDSQMEYWALGCPCGGRVMQVSGQPRATQGTGSYFWRSVARVWREARAPSEEGDLSESPFRVPLWLRCERCGQEAPILDYEPHAAAASPPSLTPPGTPPSTPPSTPSSTPSSTPRGTPRLSLPSRTEAAKSVADPREAYRCRACRRGGMDLVVGVHGRPDLDSKGTRPGGSDGTLAAEVVVRCRACERQSRIAWFDERPSAQELRLDLLYGRR